MTRRAQTVLSVYIRAISGCQKDHCHARLQYTMWFLAKAYKARNATRGHILCPTAT